MSDDELTALAREHIGLSFGLSAQQSARLRGSTRAEVESDAKQMRDELGLEPLDEHERADRHVRDQQGRFAPGDASMNARIRAAAGRST